MSMFGNGMGGMNSGMNPNMMGGQGMNPNMMGGQQGMNPNMMGGQNQGPPPLRYRKFNAGAKGPFKTYASDAGFDLSALTDGQLLPGQFGVKVSTGIGFEFPQGLFGVIKDRSSLASLGIITSGGIIDTDYRGEIIVILSNLNQKEAFNYKAGDRIAQLLILPSGTFSFVEAVDTAPVMEGARNADGFGSTNVPQ